MGKEGNEVSAGIMTLLMAREHVEKYPSVAKDTGTRERIAKHFTARVMNKANMELPVTVAAMIGLGASSSGHTSDSQ